MSKNLILTFILCCLSTSAYAAVDLQECSNQIGWDLGLNAGSTGDFTGQYPFSVKGNRISINDPSAIVSKEISDNKEVYRYKVNIGGGVFEVRTLEINKDQNGNFTVVRKDDLNAQKKAAKEAGFYDKSYDNFPVRSGLEMKYSSKTGKCEVAQAISLKSIDGKKTLGEVYIDKKYCDAIKELTKGEGQAKTQQCVDLLDKAQKLYSSRQEELLKEEKNFTNWEAGMGGAAMKLAMCSPKELEIRQEALRGLGMGNSSYYYMGGGIGMMAPVGLGGSVAPVKKNKPTSGSQ